MNYLDIANHEDRYLSKRRRTNVQKKVEDFLREVRKDVKEPVLFDGRFIHTSRGPIDLLVPVEEYYLKHSILPNTEAFVDFLGTL